MSLRSKAWAELKATLFASPCIETLSNEALWTEVISLANALMVGPVLATRMEESPGLERLAPELREYLLGLIAVTRANNQNMLDQAVEISTVLSDRGIDTLFFKGVAHLVTKTYPNVGSRYTGDIDVLVAPEKVDEAREALVDLGYVEVKSTINPDTHWHTYPLVNAELGTCVELHRRCVPQSLDGPLSNDHIWANSISVDYRNTCLSVPSIEDSVLLAIVHSELIDGQLDQFRTPLRAIVDVHFLRERLCTEPIHFGEKTRNSPIPGALSRFSASYTLTTQHDGLFLGTPTIADRCVAYLTRLALLSARGEQWLHRYHRLSPPIVERMEMTSKDLRKERLKLVRQMWLRIVSTPH